MLTPLVSTRCFEPRGVLYRNIFDCERDLSGEIKIARDAEVPREVVWLRVGDEDPRREEVGGLFAQRRRVATTAELVVEHDRASALPVQLGVREHLPVRDSWSVI